MYCGKLYTVLNSPTPHFYLRGDEPTSAADRKTIDDLIARGYPDHSAFFNSLQTRRSQRNNPISIPEITLKEHQSAPGVRGYKPPAGVPYALHPNTYASPASKQHIQQNITPQNPLVLSNECTMMGNNILSPNGKTTYYPCNGIYLRKENMPPQLLATADSTRATDFATTVTPEQLTQYKLTNKEAFREIKSVHCTITRASLAFAQSRPSNRNPDQNVIMGCSARMHAQAYGLPRGEKFSLKPNGGGWEWTHLLAYKQAPKEIEPQQIGNLVAATTGCNSKMMIAEQFVTKCLSPGSGINFVHINVLATLISGTHIAEKIYYELKWLEPFRGLRTRRYTFNALQFDAPPSFLAKLDQRLYETEQRKPEPLHAAESDISSSTIGAPGILLSPPKRKREELGHQKVRRPRQLTYGNSTTAQPTTSPPPSSVLG